MFFAVQNMISSAKPLGNICKWKQFKCHIFIAKTYGWYFPIFLFKK